MIDEDGSGGGRQTGETRTDLGVEMKVQRVKSEISARSARSCGKPCPCISLRNSKLEVHILATQPAWETDASKPGG